MHLRTTRRLLLSISPSDMPPDYEHIGLQYTDSIYVFALLLFCMPVSILFLFFNFAGNAKNLRNLFNACCTATATYFIFIAVSANLDIDAWIGVPLSLTALLASMGYVLYHPDTYGMQFVTFWSYLLIIVACHSLLSMIMPQRLGLMWLIPGFLNFHPRLQRIIFIVLLLFSASMFLLYQKSHSDSWLAQNIQGNIIVSLTSSYIFISGLSYVVFICGLSLSSPIDPVQLFSLPTALRMNAYHMLLLSLWFGLFMVGLHVQSSRDATLAQRANEVTELSADRWNEELEGNTLLRSMRNTVDDHQTKQSKTD